MLGVIVVPRNSIVFQKRKESFFVFNEPSLEVSCQFRIILFNFQLLEKSLYGYPMGLQAL